LRSSEIFLELWLLRYRAKGRNEQNVEGVSVVGVVIYFINAKYKAVICLIGLPELPGHRKAGVSKS
jgi:hypothetical protein